MKNPKPKILVVMPFSAEFNDVYAAIRRVCDKLGVEVQRLDKPAFDENLHETAQKAIRAADIVVADITDFNPNVMHEVGYAQALLKIIELIMKAPGAAAATPKIPFVLQPIHRITYPSFEYLEAELFVALAEAIERAKKSPYVINVHGRDIPEVIAQEGDPPLIEVPGPGGESEFSFKASLINTSPRILPPNYYAYLFSRRNCTIRPLTFEGAYGFKAKVAGPFNLDPEPEDELGWRYRLNIALPALPPNASEDFQVFVESAPDERDVVELLKIRICTDIRTFVFPFRLVIRP